MSSGNPFRSRSIGGVLLGTAFLLLPAVLSLVQAEGERIPLEGSLLVQGRGALLDGESHFEGWGVLAFLFTERNSPPHLEGEGWGRVVVHSAEVSRACIPRGPCEEVVGPDRLTVFESPRLEFKLEGARGDLTLLFTTQGPSSILSTESQGSSSIDVLPHVRIARPQAPDVGVGSQGYYDVDRTLKGPILEARGYGNSSGRGSFSLFVYGGTLVLRKDDGGLVIVETGRIPKDSRIPGTERFVLSNATAEIGKGSFSLGEESWTLYSTTLRTYFEGRLAIDRAEGIVKTPWGSREVQGEPFRAEGDLNLNSSTDPLRVDAFRLVARSSNAPWPWAVEESSSERASTSLGLFALGGVLAFALGRSLYRDSSLTIRKGEEDLLEAMRERRWSEVVEISSALLSQRPSDPTLLLDRAIALEKLGRAQKARGDFERALESSPSNPEIEYYYGRHLLKRGMSVAGWAHLRRALLLSPPLKEVARLDPEMTPFRDHPLLFDPESPDRIGR